MATKWQIQCITIETDGTHQPDMSARPELRVICESSDHEDVMHTFASYCSGLCDYDGPHYNASYLATPATFYRIVEVWEG